MSYRVCGKCKSTQVVKIGYSAGRFTEYMCKVCGRFGLGDVFPIATLFDQITTSPEALAPKFVYFAMADEYGRDYWGSSLIDGKFWKTEKEAIAATLAKLKEITNG